MKILLTALGGILIGPVVGFFGSGPVFHAIYYKGCMTGLTVLNKGLTVGAPIGAVTFAVIGFWLGYAQQFTKATEEANRWLRCHVRPQDFIRQPQWRE